MAERNGLRRPAPSRIRRAAGREGVSTPIVVHFGPEICGAYGSATEREWLVTNGLGGFACGTVAGIQTRRYHGLLIASLPEIGRTLLVSRVEEVLRYAGGEYALSANRWASGTVEPQGFRFIEEFHLAGSIPVWRFACADAVLEKRVWMQDNANTTFIRYDLIAWFGASRTGSENSRELPRHPQHHTSR